MKPSLPWLRTGLALALLALRKPAEPEPVEAQP